jgi:type I restriction enzyme S subunit
LGAVPVHWRTERLKYLASVNDEVLPENTDPGLEILYVDIGDVDSDRGITNKDTFTFATAPSRARRIVRDGDVIISTVRTYLRAIAKVVEPQTNTIVSTGFAVIRPRRLDTSFAAYALRSPYFVERVVANSVGVGYPSIQASELVSLAVAFPDLDEQRAIAVFLDRETARIDALVAKRECLIELLEEKRAVLITRAVTQGLDPTVPMKKSGMGWVRRIPAHWQATRIKWVAKMESGHTPDKKVEAYWDGNVPWVSLNDTGYMRNHDYITETAFYTTVEGLAHSSAHLLPAGSVVFSRDATIGRCSIITRPMAVSQHFIAWVCGNDIVPDYLLKVLQSMTQELERVTMGATLRTIGMPDVKSLVTPVPPVDEQRRIVDYVLDKRNQLDVLIRRAQASIDSLKELRGALISAAVTGQIDVREHTT